MWPAEKCGKRSIANSDRQSGRIFEIRGKSAELPWTLYRRNINFSTFCSRFWLVNFRFHLQLKYIIVTNNRRTFHTQNCSTRFSCDFHITTVLFVSYRNFSHLLVCLHYRKKFVIDVNMASLSISQSKLRIHILNLSMYAYFIGLVLFHFVCLSGYLRYVLICLYVKLLFEVMTVILAIQHRKSGCKHMYIARFNTTRDRSLRNVRINKDFAVSTLYPQK